MRGLPNSIISSLIDLQNPQAEALLVGPDGTVQAIGSDEATQAKAKGVSCKWDMQQRFVMPVGGFLQSSTRSGLLPAAFAYRLQHATTAPCLELSHGH